MVYIVYYSLADYLSIINSDIQMQFYVEQVTYPLY